MIKINRSRSSKQSSEVSDSLRVVFRSFFVNFKWKKIVSLDFRFRFDHIIFLFEFRLGEFSRKDSACRSCCSSTSVMQHVAFGPPQISRCRAQTIRRPWPKQQSFVKTQLWECFRQLEDRRPLNKWNSERIIFWTKTQRIISRWWNCENFHD